MIVRNALCARFSALVRLRIRLKAVIGANIEFNKRSLVFLVNEENFRLILNKINNF